MHSVCWRGDVGGEFLKWVMGGLSSEGRVEVARGGMKARKSQELKRNQNGITCANVHDTKPRLKT